MKYIKPLLVVLFIMLAGCDALVESKAQPAGFKAEDIHVEWTFTRWKENPEQLLIEVIDAAEVSLDMAIYSLTHPDIVKALKEAHQRGVAVRVLTDKIQAGGKSQTEALKILGSAGVPTKINSHSGLMHLKMTIADKKVATTGSYNYSQAASTRNDEILMIIRDEDIARSFSEEFETMWNDDKRFESIERRIAEDEASAGDQQNSDKSNQKEANPPEEASVPGAIPEPQQIAQAEAGCANPEVKGNISSTKEKIYHVPGGQFYERTVAEEMFCSAEEAELAGYRASLR